MKKMVSFEKPEKMPPKVIKNIETLKKMKYRDIDYSDIPPLDKSQLVEIAKIVRERKEPMPSITLRLPASVLNRYKELGKGYSSVMSHILCDYIQETQGKKTGVAPV
ncbi:hypothetical protein FACS189450_13390 [Spirochaetia bacterium]|nr:hypothetical protein FACS189450_13390 [Spirochaetia bacterium]